MGSSTADGLEKEPREWQPGDVVLGLYRVQRVLGRGGMGTVYKVRHLGWDIDLAVKSPRWRILSRVQGPETFERECETWVNLGLHPNIASCYYVRRVEGLPRVFAEYVDGGTLWSWIQQNRLYRGETQEVLERLLDVACQFAWGLRHAHSAGLVHQDVKPANVLMTRKGVPKVTDFGLSKAIVAARGGAGASQSIYARGTPAYCSPEQARQVDLTPASDVWSWAVCVLEMFVGDVTWMAGQVAGKAFEAYLELGPENDRIPPMPKEVAGLLRRCFQPAPKDRPRNMAEIIAALEQAYANVSGSTYPRKPPAAEAISTDRLNNRAVSAMDLGKRKEAERLWAEVLKEDSTHLEGLYNYTLARWRRGRLLDVAALKHIEQLRRRSDDAAPAAYLLAQIHLERGDYESAARALEPFSGGEVDGHDVQEALDHAGQQTDQSRKLLRSFGEHGGPIVTLCLSWDSRLALAGGGLAGQPGLLKLWDVDTSDCLASFEGFEQMVTTAGFTSDGLHVLAGCADGTLWMFDRASTACVRVIPAHEGVLHCVTLTKDGLQLVSAGADGCIRMWEPMTGQCKKTFEGHQGAVTAVSPGGFGVHLVSTGADGTVRVWDIESGQCLMTMGEGGPPLTSLAVSANQHYAVTGSSQGTVAYWDLRKGAHRHSLNAHKAPVMSIAFTNDMAYVVTATPTDGARIWERRSGRCLFSFKARSPLNLSADGAHALSGDSKGVLHWWRLGCDHPPYVAPMMLCQTSISA